MQAKGRNRIRAVAMTAALTAGLALTGAASAGVVLYDTTWMTDNNSYNNSQFSQIAAHSFSPNIIADSQLADDFTLGGTYNITTVTGDFLSNGTWGGEGVLVEFFSDNGGAPSAVASSQFFATAGNGLTVTTFTNHLGGSQSNGMRFTVDLSSAGITLGSGTWWMSIVAVHETTPSLRYTWVRTTEYQEGGVLHRRDGGAAHGNGYGGIYGTSDWTAFSPPGDVAMRVEGTLVPGPGTLMVLSAFGLLGARRRRL